MNTYIHTQTYYTKKYNNYTYTTSITTVVQCILMPPPFSFILPPPHSFVCSDWLHAQSYDYDGSGKAVLSSHSPKQINYIKFSFSEP